MAKKLSDLCTLPSGSADPLIKKVSADSRKVAKGSLFAALQGDVSDGRIYIASAIEKGAAAIITDDSADLPDEVEANGIPVIISDNPRRDYALACAAFYDEKPKFIVAVTGTNGKTSVADFTRQIWKHLAFSAASMGTLGIRADLLNSPGGLTTPDPAKLHHNLSLIAEAGVTHCALEASSHGLVQERLAGAQFQGAGFTNLSRDHLDYHKDEESYYAAKKRLFTDYLTEGGLAAIHVDSPKGKRLAQELKDQGIRVMTVGHDIDADVLVLTIIPRQEGLEVDLVVDGGHVEVIIPLMGVFQADNALLAACLASCAGIDLIDCLRAAEHLVGVSGRMQFLGMTESGGGVYVDFAHTPDGLENVLHAARAHTDGVLSILFGCGGNRDKGKRPIMGEIAHRLADKVYITDDNPRDEDAAVIRSEILDACPKAQEFSDRAVAINKAIKGLNSGDILIIAGKGHEEGQIVGGQVLPFSDIRTANKILKKSKMAKDLMAENLKANL